MADFKTEITEVKVIGKIETTEVRATIVGYSNPGKQGPQGIPGEDGYTPQKGTDYVDGLDITWKGTYDAETQYHINDAIFYNGSSYICILDSVGNLPTNTLYFNIMAQQGQTGAGTGDMLSSMYDPMGKQADVFDYGNFDNTPTFKTINGETITGSGDLEIIGVEDGDKGDVTVTESGETWTIDNGVVSNSKLSNMIADTIKGRVTDTGSPQDLNASQVRTIINVEDGAQVNNIIELEELPEPSSEYVNDIYKVDNKLYVCVDNTETIRWEEYGGATELEKATGAEVITGTDDEKYVTPKAIKDGMLVSGDTLPIGTQVPFTSLDIPDNWLLCDGSAISRVDYSELFNVIGTSYGAGNGTTTFNLPNKKGRTSVGHDTTQTEFNTVGKTGGSKDLQKHDHKEYFVTNDGNRNLAVTSSSGTEVGTFVKLEDSYESDRAGLVTGFAGAGDSGNLQPYETDVWIIKAKQSSGVVATVVDTLDSTSTTDALSANMGRILNEKIQLTGDYAIVTKNNDQLIPNGVYTNVTLGEFNTSNASIFAINGNGIKVLKDGKYLINISAFLLSGDTNWKVVGIAKNTTNQISGAQQVLASNVSVSVSNLVVLDLKENDTIYLNAYSYAGSLSISNVHDTTKLILTKLN